MFTCRNDKSVTNIIAITHEQLKNDFIRLSEVVVSNVFKQSNNHYEATTASSFAFHVKVDSMVPKFNESGIVIDNIQSM